MAVYFFTECVGAVESTPRLSISNLEAKSPVWHFLNVVIIMNFYNLVVLVGNMIKLHVPVVHFAVSQNIPFPFVS